MVIFSSKRGYRPCYMLDVRKYYKTAFCFVLEISAEDSETQKYINLLAKELNISEDIKKV